MRYLTLLLALALAGCNTTINNNYGAPGGDGGATGGGGGTTPGCANTFILCPVLGWCELKDGVCQATKDEHCKNSLLCQDGGGRCIAKGGFCADEQGKCGDGCGHGKWVDTPSCKKSDVCDDLGLCTFKHDRCVAASDLDCKTGKGGKPPCTNSALCHAVNSECVPASDAECKAHEHCAGKGDCSVKAFGCGPGSDADCLASSVCKSQGRCSMKTLVLAGGKVMSQCEVMSASDCKHSDLCKQNGSCKYCDGHCQQTCN